MVVVIAQYMEYMYFTIKGLLARAKFGKSIHRCPPYGVT